jgi:microcystin-dependent protein
MAETTGNGFKVIAWIGKVDRFTGEPVDRDGNSTVVSGKPQEVYVAREIYGDLRTGTTVYIDEELKYVGGVYSITPDANAMSGATIVVNGVPVYFYTGECIGEVRLEIVTGEWFAGVCEFDAGTKAYNGYERNIKLRVVQELNGVILSEREHSLLEFTGLSLKGFAALPETDFNQAVQNFLTFVAEEEDVFLENIEFINEVITYNTECAMFKGAIMMYSGQLSGIPEQWFICDGTNGRPDFRGRSPIGYIRPVADVSDMKDIDDTLYRTMNASLGEKKHKLIPSELPDFTMHLPGQMGGDNNDNNNKTAFAGGDKSPVETSFNFDLQVAYSRSKGSTQYGQPHETRQPSTVVAFLIYDPDAEWKPYT